MAGLPFTAFNFAVEITRSDASTPLVGAAFALYPMVLPASTDPNFSLTIYNTAAGAHGLRVGFVWWTIGMVLALSYFVFVYRMFRGKVRVEEGASGHGY